MRVKLIVKNKISIWICSEIYLIICDSTIFFAFVSRNNNQYKLAAPRIGFFFGPHLSRDYWPPGHENPAMGFFWGVDQD